MARTPYVKWVLKRGGDYRGKGSWDNSKKRGVKSRRGRRRNGRRKCRCAKKGKES